MIRRIPAPVLAALACAISLGAEDRGLLDPERWRRHGVEELAPLWLKHAPDVANGGFHASLDRAWQPSEPRDKMPAMQSRQIYGLCAAYLLSGDERYLDAARQGVRFLLDRGWDAKYGGWFDRLSASGEPIEDTKSVSRQLYTNVGLAMWAFVTGDREALRRVRLSVEIRRRKAWDPVFGGYVQQLSRDLAALDWGKNKHSHYGYVGSLLLNLYLAAPDPETLAFSRELTDLTLEKMRGPGEWLFGFHSKFDREWKRTPKLVTGAEAVSVGAQLTAALSLFRLTQQSGEKRYLEAALDLGRRTTESGFDAARGAWLNEIAAEPPHRALGKQRIDWWIQIYGAFLQLHLYHATGERRYLEHFEASERFFESAFMDRERGGVFDAVRLDGRPAGSLRKAGPWRTSYHEMEHALLNYVYLGLYVHRRPVELHFRLDGPGEFFVSPADAPGVRVEGVVRDGRPWRDFDARRRSVRLPAGRAQKVVVKLAFAGGEEAR